MFYNRTSRDQITRNALAKYPHGDRPRIDSQGRVYLHIGGREWYVGRAEDLAKPTEVHWWPSTENQE